MAVEKEREKLGPILAANGTNSIVSLNESRAEKQPASLLPVFGLIWSIYSLQLVSLPSAGARRSRNIVASVTSAASLVL